MAKKEEKVISGEDFALLQRIKGLTPGAKQKNRLETIKGNTRRIKHFGRSIIHKKQQIKDETCVEKHEGYIGDIKPLFMLDNEIEEINAQIEQLKEINKATQEEYDKDAA